MSYDSYSDPYYVICPHCEHRHTDAWEITGNDEEDHEKDCEKCGKPFVCRAVASIRYESDPIPAKSGDA